MATEHIQLNVVGMSCEHCRCRVQRALESVPGVHSADVDLRTGTVSVEAEEGLISQEQLAAEVVNVGYAVGGMNTP